MIIGDDMKKILKEKQVNYTFKAGNFLWVRHNSPFKKMIARLILNVYRKRYCKNALAFLENEKTKDDSF